MRRFAPGKQHKRMRNQRKDGLEGGCRSARTAGKVEDERLIERSAESAAQDSKWCFATAFGAHQLRNAIDETVADITGCFRGYVARADACAASRHDKSHAGGAAFESALNCRSFIGNGHAAQHFKTVAGKELRHCRTGQINPGAQMAGVADGDHGGSKHYF